MASERRDCEQTNLLCAQTKNLLWKAVENKDLLVFFAIFANSLANFAVKSFIAIEQL
jgi:hypothetical protein